MASALVASDDPLHTVFLVGQDRRGRWMVQENHGLIEGSFISREAALGFARSERLSYPDAVVALAATPLVPAFLR